MFLKRFGQNTKIRGNGALDILHIKGSDKYPELRKGGLAGTGHVGPNGYAVVT